MKMTLSPCEELDQPEYSWSNQNLHFELNCRRQNYAFETEK